MFLYRNHRLYYGNVSFQIPDGFFLDANPDEDTDDYLKLVAPDESYSIDIRFYQDSMDAKAELESVIHDLRAEIFYPVAPIIMGGLPGYHATYRDRRTQYYEAWFDIEESFTLDMVFYTKCDILSIDTAAVVAAIDLRRETE